MGKWTYRADGLPAVSTFSIVAVDVHTGEVGVAVQSKFLAVGAAVPWVSADAGAVATQSWANTSFGPNGLAKLRSGLHPEIVLQELLADDADVEQRQVGLVDLNGRSATFTGSQCFPYAGGIAGEGFACQGNILAGSAVVENMAASFSSLEGPLPERLLKALQAGQQAGGDRRGMQSAALYIAKPKGGYGGFNDRYIDLRVDDHATPIDELERLLELHRLYFERSQPDDLLSLSGDVLKEVQRLLLQRGYQPDEAEDYTHVTREALKTYYLTENFDERWTDKGVIDRRVLAYLRKGE